MSDKPGSARSRMPSLPEAHTHTHFHLLFSMQTSSFFPCFSYLRPSTLCGQGALSLFFRFCFLAGTPSEDVNLFSLFSLFPWLLSSPSLRAQKETSIIWRGKKKESHSFAKSYYPVNGLPRHETSPSFPPFACSAFQKVCP